MIRYTMESYLEFSMTDFSKMCELKWSLLKLSFLKEFKRVRFRES